MAQMLRMILLGDRLSLEVAAINGVDPMEIPRLEAVKRRVRASWQNPIDEVDCAK